MSTASDYWANAQSGSPGTKLAEMQARLYAGVTTQRMMEKFDRKLQTFTMGISDPTELDAAQQRAQALADILPVGSSGSRRGDRARARFFC